MLRVSLPVLTLLALLAAACNGDPGAVTIALTFDPCETLVVVPAADTTTAQKGSIAAALSWWNTIAGTKLTLDDTATNAAAPHIPMIFKSAPGAFYGLYEDKVGDILINANLTDDHERAVCIAHELGHAMGLFHISGRDSVMNSPNLTVEPNPSDGADVSSLWGACPR